MSDAEALGSSEQTGVSKLVDRFARGFGPRKGFRELSGVGPIGALWRDERQARLYFIAVAQSAVGTGAGYVALLLVAYDRLASPWAISLVLLADFVPSMLLGPLLGSVVDRLDRLRCAIGADLQCACAFAAICFGGGFVPLLLLALCAGVGNALFRPASLSLMPQVVAKKRLPAANGLFRASRDSGVMLGPAVAGAALLLTGPNALLLFNAVTFAVSALLLSRLRRTEVITGTPDGQDHGLGASLLAETRAGLRAIAGLPVVPAVLAACAAAALFGGLMNVAELILARDEFESGGAGYALLVAAFGIGQVTGAIVGARDGDDASMKSRLITALAMLGGGLALSGAAQSSGMAAVTFALTGVGTGVLLVSSSILLQRLVPPGLHGRVFGAASSLEAGAFCIALLGSGLLVTTLGVRWVFLIAGAGVLAVSAVCRTTLTAEPEPKSISAGRRERGIDASRNAS